MPSIQVVDISAISLATTSPAEDDYKALADVLSSCFKDIGFVYVKNHGIRDDIVQKAMQTSMRFFNLGKEIKLLTTKGPEYQGWVEQGREIFDQDENGKIAELEVRETYDLKNISTEGKFPDKDCPELREGLTGLAKAGSSLATRLLRCISLSLDQDPSFLSNVHQGMMSQGLPGSVENSTTIRSIHYPPIPDNLAAQPGIIRCGEHSDYGTITLLFQDQLGGLEVKGVDGQWVMGDPIPGTILINVGDLLEAMSAGQFPATKHRVVVPEQEFRRKTLRQSIVFFVHPDDEVVCQPLSGPDERYPPITARGHLEKRFQATYGDRLKE